MSRRQTLAAIDAPVFIEDPQPGTRLHLGVVAARLGVSITQMAECTAISRTAIADLLSNKWPVKTPQEGIRTALLRLMEQRGAIDEELQHLFHGQGRQSGSRGQRETRGPDERAPELPLPSYPPRPPRQTRRATYHPYDPHFNSQPEDPAMLPLKATLTPQAKRHFSLFRNPFDGPVATDEQMYLGDEFRYCRESAWQCAQTSGFVAIVGESGAGKTTVLEDLEERLQRDAERVILIKPSVVGMEQNDTKGKTLKSSDILSAIITQLAPEAPMPQTVQARTVRAKKLLSASVQMGYSHLLVVEEAHRMPDATFTHLKRLHEVRDGRRSLMGILLLAQPELKRRLTDGLRDGTLREVAQRCELLELLPLDGNVKAYLERRASAFNVKLDRLIDDDGIAAIQERLTRRTERGAVSMCYPLAVANLVVMAMNAAANLGAPVITADVVKAA